MVKRLPTMWETRVRSLGWEDPLEKEMATQVLLPGKSHGWRSVVSYSPWGCKESDMTEQLHFHFKLLDSPILYVGNFNSKWIFKRFCLLPFLKQKKMYLFGFIYWQCQCSSLFWGEVSYPKHAHLVFHLQVTLEGE